MLLAGLNFTHLSVEGYASFILALIFTIITIASAIYVARHKDLNKIATIVLILLVPMIAVFCWIYLLLTVLGHPLVNVLCISFACAIAYGLIAFGIGYLASLSKARNQANKENEDNQNEENTDETPNEESEETPALTFVSLEESKKSDENEK